MQLNVSLSKSGRVTGRQAVEACGKPERRKTSGSKWWISRETIPVNFPTILFPHLSNCLFFYMSFLKLMMLEFCEEILLDAIAHVGPESMPRPRPCFAEPGHHQHHNKRVWQNCIYTVYIGLSPLPVRVTTRTTTIITCFVGHNYYPELLTITGRGDNQKHVYTSTKLLGWCFFQKHGKKYHWVYPMRCLGFLPTANSSIYGIPPYSGPC